MFTGELNYTGVKLNKEKSVVNCFYFLIRPINNTVNIFVDFFYRSNTIFLVSTKPCPEPDEGSPTLS
jgi:hypothetical protein